MSDNNRTLLRKADLAVSDLITDGGYLVDEQASALVQGIIDQASIVPLLSVVPMQAPTQFIDSVAISGSVLRAANSGVALSPTERIKPVTDQVELTTRLCRAEVDLPQEVLEDVVGNGTLTSTLQSMLQEAIARDLDLVVVGGDTTSTDQVLSLWDGMIKLATSHTVNVGDNYLTKDYLLRGAIAMPTRYWRRKADMRWMTSVSTEFRYRDEIANRVGPLGDLSLQSANPLTHQGVPILGSFAFPENIGTGTHCTAALLGVPQLARLGVWRQINIETDRDIRTGTWICVASLRMGFQYVEEAGWVKLYNVKAN